MANKHVYIDKKREIVNEFEERNYSLLGLNIFRLKENDENVKSDRQDRVLFNEFYHEFIKNNQYLHTEYILIRGYVAEHILVLNGNLYFRLVNKGKDTFIDFPLMAE